MPNKRIAMRNICEILRLRFEVGLSFRQISEWADVNIGAIQKMRKRLEASVLSWPRLQGIYAVTAGLDAQHRRDAGVLRRCSCSPDTR